MTILDILIIVTSTFLITVFLTPIIKKLAFHINALDIPDARKVHSKIMPRLGGLAIFLGFLFGYMLFGQNSTQMVSILIASIVIILGGICDDIKPLEAKLKFLFQLTSALIIVYYGQIQLLDITAFGYEITFGFLAPFITIFFILGCINCMNLIDGLDGLAAGTATIFFSTVGIIAYITGNLFGLEVVLTFIMLGSTLGFLFHNFNPASIFMGDSGSMFLGLIISIIALLGYKNITLTSFIVPLLILMVPILDTLFAIIRRLLSGKKLSDADKNHLHHQFLKMNYSHRNSVLIIYFINILFAIASIIYIIGDSTMGIIIYIIIFFILIWLITTTNIIFIKKDMTKRKK